jgi:hypothetical protein
MNSFDPATAAFIRYLRREIEALSAPIEAGCQHVAGCADARAPEIIRMTLRSIAGYFVQMSGAMTDPTSNFWSDIAEFFESQFGAFPPAGERDADFFAQMADTKRPSQLFGPGAVDLRVLPAVDFFDRANNSAYLGRTKMFLWRFAAAFVAADLEGTILEEGALDEFRKVLDAGTNPAPSEQPQVE